MTDTERERRREESVRSVVIDGERLNLWDAVDLVTAPTGAKAVTVLSDAVDKMDAARRQIEAWLTDGDKSVYGLNTGLGSLKDAAVPIDRQQEFQRRMLLSHSTAPGNPWPDDVVRLAILLRANVFARGTSGVRAALISRLLDLFNAGITPVVGSQGSLGLGDLPPMAQIGLVVAGMPQGRARWNDEVGSAPDILTKAGLPVAFSLHAREALALTSGSTLTLAAAAVAVMRAKRLLAVADLAAALTLEALRGETAALDPRIHAARPHPGQIASAARLRALLVGSRWVSPEARGRLGETAARVQDAISIRCTPQVHGAIIDALSFAATVLERESNASTDNPLLFPTEDGGYEAISGGNSHAAPIGYATDFLAFAMTDLAVLSERRAFRLLDPNLNYGLPPNLIDGDAGLDSGLAVGQSSASAMIAEMRTLATPATGSNVPTKSNQEDHVSMADWSARKLLRILDLAEWVIAMELLCACRAVELLRTRLEDLPMGDGTGRAYNLVKQHPSAPLNDSWVLEQWRAMHRLVVDGVFTHHVLDRTVVK